MAVFINFGVIVVNNLTNNAGIFFGENVQQGWVSPAKTNQAVNIFGNGNLTVSNININSDPDLVDTPTYFTDLNVPTAPVILKAT
jgi:translation initiation factor RLI1